MSEDNALAPRNFGIFYHPDGYTVGPKLMGRNAAGESFLRGVFQHARASRFTVQVRDKTHAAGFAREAAAHGRHEPVDLVDLSNLDDLARAGVLYLPGPGLGKEARRRSFHGHRRWSLCGITHTTCSAGAMDDIVELVTAPVQSWDALICTSSAVKQNVEHLLGREAAYLRDRLGASRIVLPQLPVIPLGIHTRDFDYGPQARQAARAALSLDPDTIVVMFMGRLAFHAKAHPMPMYLALEQTARTTGRKIALIECGWHGNESVAQAYQEAAARLCPSVRAITIEGRKPSERDKAWAAADIFCSLSDNIQETFGITPIEAMAAGLPVVVSDWDGYKDTVRDGVDGFRIPTTMPGAGLGGDLAYRHALALTSYDMYVGETCSLTAVDVGATAAAFVKLAESHELRQKMGTAGRARAREVFDWSSIIHRYEDLWARLDEMRARAGRDTPSEGAAVWPGRPDPFAAFACYPTRILNPDTVLAAADGGVDALCARAEMIRSLAMVSYAARVLPTPEEVRAVLEKVAAGPLRAGDLVSDLSPDRRAHVLRGLGWLLKSGLLNVVS